LKVAAVEVKKRLSAEMVESALDEAYNSARELQLFLQLFNTANRSSTFLNKICYLANSVFDIFIAIQYVDEFPGFAAIFFFTGIFIMLLFIFTYGRAFEIPDGMNDLKREMELANLFLEDGVKKAANRRAIASIPCVGIELGSFKVIERSATPEFLGKPYIFSYRLLTFSL